MMTDLEDDPNWSLSDTTEEDDEDTERFELILSKIGYNLIVFKVMLRWERVVSTGCAVRLAAKPFFR